MKLKYPFIVSTGGFVLGVQTIYFLKTLKTIYYIINGNPFRVTFHLQ